MKNNNNKCNNKQNHILQMLWNALETLFNNFDEEYNGQCEDKTLGDLIWMSLEAHLPNLGKLACFKYSGDHKLNVESSLFNNNSNAKNWLLEFIGNNIPNYRSFLQDNDYEIDFGIKYYICHYITIVLYCLFENSDDPKSKLFIETEMKLNNNKFSKEDFKPFYELIRQFSVYNACFPRQDRSEETFYLQLFAKC